MTLPALVLFSHGSLLCGSDRLLNNHVAKLRRWELFLTVEPGFLNYSRPSIETAVERCIAAGTRQIVVVPYFLVAGKFVTEDLPARLKSVVERHEETEIILARAIEDAIGIVPAILEAACLAVPVEQWQRGAVEEAQAACEMRKDCPFYGSELCRTGAKS